jgi:S1-C subfamily serine protease/regulator of sirC expression with transglutaminase-like and TPR domain
VGFSRWLTALVALVLLAIHSSHAAHKPASSKQPTAKTKPTAAPPETASIEALTAKALKAVVVIKHFGRDGREDGVGAGFVVSADGLIATSLHVIGEARPITVQLADGQRHEATEIFASDRNFDLAIIRIAAGKLPALPLGDSDSLKQGATVIALGNPLGLEHSVVRGVVSARREMEGVEMIQVAIPIEPGNSGGPLLDLKGRVHGILTLKSAMTRNLGFAMPANLLKSLLEKPNPVPIRRWLTIGALPPREWQPLFGARWSQKAGRIHVEGEGRGFGGRSLCLSQKSVPARPYEVAVSVRLNDEAGAAGLVFASDGGDRHYGFYPSGGQLRLTRFEGPNVFSWSILKQVPTEHYRPGDWNHLRVRVEPEKILCYVNGELVAESDDNALGAGQAGLAKFRDTRAEFKGFQVGTNLLVLSLRQAESEPGVQSRTSNARGPAALQQRARELEQEAARLRRRAALLHRESVLAELSQTLEGPEEQIDLLRAALLVARLDNAELEIEPYRQQVAEMAREMATRLPAKADDAARLSALREYLFSENGFHGSRSDYYNRANSYLDRVLDDREGLPITLSILFMELAQRIGLDGVGGLPLPGHFMVAYTPKQGPEQIIDVFNGGKVLSRSDAQERIIEATGEGFRDSDYRRATKREIIVRMLRNLLGIAQRGDAAETLRYLDAIVALEPDSASDRLGRAALRLKTGDTAGAKEDFKWLLDRQPPGVDLERVAEIYRTL